MLDGNYVAVRTIQINKPEMCGTNIKILMSVFLFYVENDNKSVDHRDPESDSPLPVFLLYLWASRCNLAGIQPIQSRLRLGCIAALPR
jgi:hypothetical protein